MTPRIKAALESPVTLSPGEALNAWQRHEERLFVGKQRKWGFSLTTNGFKSFRATLTRKI